MLLGEALLSLGSFDFEVVDELCQVTKRDFLRFGDLCHIRKFVLESLIVVDKCLVLEFLIFFDLT